MTARDGSARDPLAGFDRVRPGRDEDAIDGVVPRLVAEPSDAKELARLLAEASKAGLAVSPRGGGTKLGIGSAPERVDVVLSTLGLGRVLDHAHADLTVTVEAGCRVAHLQETLASRGQRLALDPAWAAGATVGGVLAANDAGALRTRFGPARNHVLGVRVALADGTLARSGGKVVKNVAGYDLPKLLCGSLGTLGVIVEATFRLHAIPNATRDFSWSFERASDASEFLRAALDARVAPTCAQVSARRGAASVVDVRLEVAAGTAAARASHLEGLARCGEPRDARPDVWLVAERLRSEAVEALVLKVGVRPGLVGVFVDQVGGAAEAGALDWSLVVQSDGVGYVRLDGQSASYPGAIDAIRRSCVYAVVESCPAEIKRAVSVWGPAHDALPVMRRVKENFDPRRTLNPGRFVGGI